ncbi:MAG: hypothetical protein IID46_05530 [Planctomycetes bacterium]|nr:hypothetical protein [Planctomycetota bacterium]
MRFFPVFLLLFGVMGCESGSQSGTLTDEEFAAHEQAIAAIKKSGGTGTVVITGPNSSVIRVGFRDSKVTDAGLVHLKRLTSLETLLLGHTQVTDAGLVHLKGLTNLIILHLGGTKVTDESVKTLQTAILSCSILR